MLSANRIKFVRSLQQKKFRNAENLFIAEGSKLVGEILSSSLRLSHVYHTSAWEGGARDVTLEQISPAEMGRISGLKTPTEVLAIVSRPEHSLSIDRLQNTLALALDDIQDPGNLGTIIRLAHWFGIETIICSEGTVDAYSPKVVQATMGAIVNVQVVYTSLITMANQALRLGIPLIGTFLEGQDIYTAPLPKSGIIVLGNEGSGINPQLEALISSKITIPSFATSREGSESLNVSMAAAIVCSEFRRRSL